MGTVCWCAQARRRRDAGARRAHARRPQRDPRPLDHGGDAPAAAAAARRGVPTASLPELVCAARLDLPDGGAGRPLGGSPKLHVTLVFLGARESAEGIWEAASGAADGLAAPRVRADAAWSGCRAGARGCSRWTWRTRAGAARRCTRPSSTALGEPVDAPVLAPRDAAAGAARAAGPRRPPPPGDLEPFAPTRPDALSQPPGAAGVALRGAGAPGPLTRGRAAQAIAPRCVPAVWPARCSSRLLAALLARRAGRGRPAARHAARVRGRAAPVSRASRWTGPPAWPSSAGARPPTGIVTGRASRARASATGTSPCSARGDAPRRLHVLRRRRAGRGPRAGRRGACSSRPAAGWAPSAPCRCRSSVRRACPAGRRSAAQLVEVAARRRRRPRAAWRRTGLDVTHDAEPGTRKRRRLLAGRARAARRAPASAP